MPLVCNCLEQKSLWRDTCDWIVHLLWSSHNETSLCDVKMSARLATERNLCQSLLRWQPIHILDSSKRREVAYQSLITAFLDTELAFSGTTFESHRDVYLRPKDKPVTCRWALLCPCALALFLLACLDARRFCSLVIYTTVLSILPAEHPHNIHSIWRLIPTSDVPFLPF